MPIHVTRLGQDELAVPGELAGVVRDAAEVVVGVRQRFRCDARPGAAARRAGRAGRLTRGTAMIRTASADATATRPAIATKTPLKICMLII